MTKKSYEYISRCQIHYAKKELKLSFGIGGGFLDIHAFTSNKDVFVAKGPDNPSTTDIFYVVERSFDKSVVFVNVIEAYKLSSKIPKLDVNFRDGLVDIRIEEKQGALLRIAKSLFNSKAFTY